MQYSSIASVDLQQQKQILRQRQFQRASGSDAGGFLSMLAGVQKPPPTETVKQPDPPREAAQEAADDKRRDPETQPVSRAVQERPLKRPEEDETREAERSAAGIDADAKSLPVVAAKLDDQRKDPQLMEKISVQLEKIRRMINSAPEKSTKAQGDGNGISRDALFGALEQLLQQARQEGRLQEKELRQEFRKLGALMQKQPGLQSAGKQLDSLFKQGNTPKEIALSAEKVLQTLQKFREKSDASVPQNSVSRKSEVLEPKAKIEVKDLRGNEFQALDPGHLKSRIEQARSRHYEKSVQTKISADGTRPAAEVDFEGAVRAKAEPGSQEQLNRDGMFFRQQEAGKPALAGKTLFTRKTGIQNPRVVFDQVVQRATITHRSGMSEMKLHLNPKKLGRIAMKLVIKDGQLSGTLQAASESVRQLLKSNLGLLQQELRDAGMNLEQLVISDEKRHGLPWGGESRQGTDRDSSSQNPEHGFRNPAVTGTVPEIAVPVAERSGSGHAGNINLVA